MGATAAAPDAAIEIGGDCYAFFAFDIGLSTDLTGVAGALRESAARQVARDRRRAPAWLAYEPAPLRLALRASPIEIGAFRTEAEVACTLYDFGAASLAYRIPIDGRRLDDLPGLSHLLYDNAPLLDDSRRQIESLLSGLAPHIAKPELNRRWEDYIVFALRRWDGAGDAASAVITGRRETIARILEAEDGPLDPQQIDEAIAARIAFSPEDAAIVNWHAAIVLDPAPDDALAVLEHANVELLEMRVLDDRLDGVLERAYGLLAAQSRASVWPRPSGAAALRELADLQADASLLFEGVHNAIKLLGDQYLARLYRLASQRMHLPAWDASALRKIETAESIYQKIAGFQATRRMEVLEIAIVVLIIVSIVLPFIGMGGH